MTTANAGGNITADGGRQSLQEVSAMQQLPDRQLAIQWCQGEPASVHLQAFQDSYLETYHVRAYATNGAGTSYGNEVTFTTYPAVAPTLSTAAITAITLTTAVSGGNISSDGGAAISEKGICWATTSVSYNKRFQRHLTEQEQELHKQHCWPVPGTIYHVRAYATNARVLPTEMTYSSLQLL